MSHRSLIIGIGERSWIVDRRIQDSVAADERRHCGFLSIDYKREPEELTKADYFDSEILLPLSIQSEKQTKEEDLAGDPAPRTQVSPDDPLVEEYGRVKRHIDQVNRDICEGLPPELSVKAFELSMDTYELIRRMVMRKLSDLAEYVQDSESAYSEIRVIVHATLNLDAADGLDSAQKAAFRTRSTDSKSQNDTSSAEGTYYPFSRILLLAVLGILFQMPPTYNIKVYPVILFRTSLSSRRRLKAEKWHRALEILNNGLFAGQYEKTAFDKHHRFGRCFLVQDKGNEGEEFNLHEHVSLLFLTVSVLAGAGASFGEISLSRDFNRVLNELNVADTAFFPRPPDKREKDGTGATNSMPQSEEAEGFFTSVGFNCKVISFRTMRRLLNRYVIVKGLQRLFLDEKARRSTGHGRDRSDVEIVDKLSRIIARGMTLDESTSSGEAEAQPEANTLERWQSLMVADDPDLRKELGDRGTLAKQISHTAVGNRDFAKFRQDLKRLRNRIRFSLRVRYRDIAQDLVALHEQVEDYLRRLPVHTEDKLNSTLHRIDMRCARKTSDKLAEVERLANAVVRRNAREACLAPYRHDTIAVQSISGVLDNLDYRTSWRTLETALERSGRLIQHDVLPGLLADFSEKFKSQRDPLRDRSQITNTLERAAQTLRKIPGAAFRFMAPLVLTIGFGVLTGPYLLDMPMDAPVSQSISIVKRASFALAGGLHSIFQALQIPEETASPVYPYRMRYPEFAYLAAYTLLGLLSCILTSAFYRFRGLAQLAEYARTLDQMDRDIQGFHVQILKNQIALRASAFFTELGNRVESMRGYAAHIRANSTNIIDRMQANLVEQFGAGQQIQGEYEIRKSSLFPELPLDEFNIRNQIYHDVLAGHREKLLKAIGEESGQYALEVEEIKDRLYRFGENPADVLEDFRRTVESEDGINFGVVSKTLASIRPGLKDIVKLSTDTSSKFIPLYKPNAEKDLTEISPSGVDWTLLNDEQDQSIYTMFLLSVPVKLADLEHIDREGSEIDAKTSDKEKRKEAAQ